MRTLTRSLLLAVFAAGMLFLAPAIEYTQRLMTVEPSEMTDNAYEKEWKKVQEALDKGLPKSAIEIVEKIYERARQENNQPQIIKSTAYRVALLAQTSENGEVILIRDIEKAIAESRQPVRPIFQSMLADLYWNYYQINRWRINQRTQVEDTTSSDFRTWDATVFFDTTGALYLSSLEAESELQKIPVDDFRDILIGRSESENYRPTMFDVLVHRALDFFQNDETRLPKAVQEFEVASLDAVLPAEMFLAHSFASPDPRDGRFVALQLYQKLLRFHRGDSDPDAFADADMLRLAFGRRITLNEDKDTTYFQSLASLEATHARHPIAAQAGYLMAQYLYDAGDYIASMAKIEWVLKTFPKSRGAVNCEALRSQILEKSISSQAEQTTLPSSPILYSVEYRNVGKIFCRLYEMGDENDQEEYSNRHRFSQEDWLKSILKKKPVSTWSQDLPAVKDYKGHRVDLKAPELRLGRYLMLVSPDEQFALKGNAIDYMTFQVTRLSLQSQTFDNGRIKCWVMDAANGQPLPGVSVELMARQWNSANNRYESIHLKSFKTDVDGSFVLLPDAARYDMYVKLTWKADTYTPEARFYPYERGHSTASYRTIFFTDRSIYRPGQTVYFKGIVLKGENEKAEFAVAKKFATTVTFFDANWQKIAEQSFTTNDFGSFAGTFTAPAGVLTGAMTIRDLHGSHTIRVEEYKRPKFEVSFAPLTGTYRLAETITAKGNAKSFAGSNIDGAEVKYRVVRQARFPYWWWWWRPMPVAPEKEIAHGSTRTDAKGEFTVQFDAVPDKTVDKDNLPVFYYTVTADVTDINGETRSATTSVAVGYTSVTLNAAADANIDREKKAAVAITSANLSGQPLAVQGTIRIERITPPDRIYRARNLAKADQHAMTEAEFHAAFPHDEYKDETDSEHWPVDKVILNDRFRTNERGIDSIPIEKYEQGYYRAIAETKDPSGRMITTKAYFTVYDREAKRLPYTKASMLLPLKTTAEPGETAEFLWGTSFKDAKVLYRIEHRGSIVKEEWLEFDNEQRRFTIPITEEHRGGVSAHFMFVHDYRLYQETVYIGVPWSNKQLHIETSTFRDKLRPGDKEEWRLTIKGEKAEQVASEMVATLYDASLDAIWRGYWDTFSWPSFSPRVYVGDNSFGGVSSQRYEDGWNIPRGFYGMNYDNLNLFLLGGMGWGYGMGGRARMYKSKGMRDGEEDGMVMAERSMVAADAGAPPPPPSAAPAQEGKADMAASNEPRKKEQNATQASPVSEKSDDLGGVQARANLNETAFFFPQLMTNEKGEVVLTFTIPEALTRWRLMVFAHTPDLKVGYIERSVVTQKELMVTPNAPRFFREGDVMEFPVKITNMTAKQLDGTAQIYFFDALTMQPLDKEFALADARRAFTVKAEQSAALSWEIKIPDGVGAVLYRVVAKAGDFSDGEEAPLPILPNRMLVTETLPLNVRGNQSRTYTFDKLLHSGSSSTLRHQKLTLEMTSNPAWYAVQALPYIMEYPYECSEQLFNRYYANSIASHIVNSNPKIKRIFDQWKGTDALLSNLQKNQELKSVLLQETPWVMQGKNESERKQRIALLFDLNAMANTLDAAIRKLEKAQGANGGFPWFPGMPESRYLTQYIVAGFGHLRELGVVDKDPRVERMIGNAVRYIDTQMQADFDYLKRIHGKLDPKKDYLGYQDIQYLYARGYFLAQKIDKRNQDAVDFWLDQCERYWLRRGYMAQGMIALGLFRFENQKTPKAIVASLKERSLWSDEMGMYWKMDNGWFWYQAPIETQALLIEAFDVIAQDIRSVEEMKIWLLKQKQVQDWKTTIATAEACYALLRRGSDLLASDKLVDVTMGGAKVDPQKDGGKVEAGTGYYTVSWNRGEVKPDMGKVVVTKSDAGIAWGAVYWQYFEQLDKITPAKTPLQIEKKLYRKNTTDKGLVLEPITEKNNLRVGDILTARIEIRVDRDMEYVHLKDMRGAGFEPINQLSRYRWQGGLGYYEAPKDASTNFFMYWLPKGVHVFEYDLRVSHVGRFSNGISTIQCMYAPEFAAHTQGFVVKVQ
jgi:uncharacterized protein YfaS (alpha-2-macroglobulin family)